jgi:hypothetical protein
LSANKIYRKDFTFSIFKIQNHKKIGGSTVNHGNSRSNKINLSSKPENKMGLGFDRTLTELRI